jgi:hypothetical protein
VKWHRLTDRGDQLDTVLGFLLVHVDNLEVLDHSEVNGLPELIAKGCQVRARNAPEIQACRDTVGQPQDLSAEAIAPRRLVLGYVPGLDERPKETCHGGLVEARLLADCRWAEAVPVSARQRLHDIEAATESPSHRCFT